MADIMRMENDPSMNCNNPEAKIAKEIAVQFIAKRTGKVLKNQALRKEVEVMLRAVEELEQKQGSTLQNFIKSLNITDENGFSVFSRLSDQTFNDGISWGRITSFHLFAALLVEHLRKNEQEIIAEKVGLWLGMCIAKRSSWIREQGRGWPGFIETLNGHKEIENSVFTGLFNVTLGLGTIAAALFIQAK